MNLSIDSFKDNYELIVAFLALSVSAYSVYSSKIIASMNAKHLMLSVKPYPEITVRNHQNNIKVILKNNGLGPMIVKSIHADRIGEHVKSKELVDFRPCFIPKSFWGGHSMIVDGEVSSLSIKEGAEIDLLLVEGASMQNLDELRKELSDLEVEVDYTDFYDTEYSRYIHDLKFLGSFRV